MALNFSVFLSKNFVKLDFFFYFEYSELNFLLNPSIGSRRISWGISKNKGLNVSIEDLRRRSTKFVVLGLEDVGKTGRKIHSGFILNHFSFRGEIRHETIHLRIHVRQTLVL